MICKDTCQSYDETIGWDCERNKTENVGNSKSIAIENNIEWNWIDKRVKYRKDKIANEMDVSAHSHNKLVWSESLLSLRDKKIDCLFNLREI